MKTLPLAVVASTLLLACGCATSAPATPLSSTAATPSSTSQASVLRATFKGAGAYPEVTVEVPSAHDWTMVGNFAVVSETGGSSRGVAFWDVGKVARDPCHSLGKLYDPGPSVDDLVGALRSQAMRRATAPTDTTLAGYPATYLELSVPADMVVNEEADFAGCDVQGNGHRDFVSWEGAGGQGERFHQMAGEVDRLWILEVNGQRLVVDASHSPGTTQDQIDELDAIIASVQLAPSR